MLHTKFRGNRTASSIYVRGSHLCHVTSIMSSDFRFLVLESFHKKIGSDQHSCF